MKRFKPGDKVLMYDKPYRRIVTGEITLIRDAQPRCKVLWDGDVDLNYDYYPEECLHPFPYRPEPVN